MKLRDRSEHDSWNIGDQVAQPLRSLNTYTQTILAMDSENILSKDPRRFEHGVHEAIDIRVNQPLLNRDGGAFSTATHMGQATPTEYSAEVTSPKFAE